MVRSKERSMDNSYWQYQNNSNNSAETENTARKRASKRYDKLSHSPNPPFPEEPSPSIQMPSWPTNPPPQQVRTQRSLWENSPWYGQPSAQNYPTDNRKKQPPLILPGFKSLPSRSQAGGPVSSATNQGQYSPTAPGNRPMPGGPVFPTPNYNPYSPTAPGNRPMPGNPVFPGNGRGLSVPVMPGNRPLPFRPLSNGPLLPNRPNFPPRRRKKRIITSILLGLTAILILVLSSTAGYAYTFYQRELPQVQNLANMHIAQSTRIYDRHGALLYTLYANGAWGDGGRSTPVSYDYLPGVLQDAQTSVEDPSFWTNDGIDLQGMLRALTQYVQHRGQIQSGGSTMTQQLIKNLSGQDQGTFQRKSSEAALAIGLTQQYPKWKILEMYFNVTPYGAQEKGVEAATEDYFGLTPQCDSHHNCVPAVAFLDRDLTSCKVTKPHIDQTTCKSNPILALARASLLAGIPQNPTHFDPSISQDNFLNVLKNRQPIVLQQMVKLGVHINLGLGSHTVDMGLITPEMVTQAEALTAKMQIKGFHQSMLAPHFVQWVIKTLSNSLGNYQNLDPDTGISQPGYQLLISGGFNIYTTIDLKLEQFVEQNVRHHLRYQEWQPFIGDYGPLNTVHNVNDSAVVVMDAKTGEVLAMDGSADWNDTTSPEVGGEVNAAVAYRQPGSTLKPLIYAAAFQKGWYPGIKLTDVPTYFPNGGAQSDLAENSSYHPSDYKNSFHPGVNTNLRTSLADSFNIPAVKTLMFAGFDNVITMARRLGITAIDTDLAVYNQLHHSKNTLAQKFGPSLALGTAEIPLIQMVDAYQTFPDQGVHVPYHNILDIWDNYGRQLYHYDPSHPNGTSVLSPQIAFLLNSMLSDNDARQLEFGGDPVLTMSDWPGDHPVAAKTGTTDGFQDNWTIGYTSSLVVGVWSGNANGELMASNVVGITGAAPIWHDAIECASGDVNVDPVCGNFHYATDPFPIPSGVVQAPVNTYNGLAGSGNFDWMLDGEQPEQK